MLQDDSSYLYFGDGGDTIVMMLDSQMDVDDYLNVGGDYYYYLD